MNQLTLLIKPASSLCNMRCRYCFYTDEAEHRSQGSLGIMSQDTMELLLTRAMDYIGEGGQLSVLFQGGEPTLAGADYFRAFTDAVQRRLPKGASVHYALQTNGFALSDELIRLFRQHSFLIGISLDGCRTLHDHHRIDTAGQGTWQRVLGNLKKLQAAGVETNALCVITAQAAGNAQKIYRTLKQLGFRHQQYIPCLDPLEVPRGSMPFSLTPEDYGRFLVDAFACWYADWKRGDYVSIRTFEDLVLNGMGLPCSSCASSGKCGQYLVLEADGSAYPCDFFALDAWKLGNIQDASISQLLTGSTAQRFAALRSQPPAECADCPYRMLCRTGCFRDWEPAEGGYRNYYCTATRTLLEHSLSRLEEIAQSQWRTRKGKP